MPRKVIMSLLLVAVLLSACESDPVSVLQSPCVGAEGSPCGPKRDVNGWWLHLPVAREAQQS